MRPIERRYEGNFPSKRRIRDIVPEDFLKLGLEAFAYKPSVGEVVVVHSPTGEEEVVIHWDNDFPYYINATIAGHVTLWIADGIRWVEAHWEYDEHRTGWDFVLWVTYPEVAPKRPPIP